MISAPLLAKGAFVGEAPGFRLARKLDVGAAGAQYWRVCLRNGCD